MYNLLINRTINNT